MLLVAAASCSDDSVHVFGANRYDPTRDCLEPGAAIDVIDGPDPGACDALRCWISPADEVYVTTTACDAPPGYVEHSTDRAKTLCGKAILAYLRDDHGACP
jgi:hypothetical protein